MNYFYDSYFLCVMFQWAIYVHPIYAESGDYPPIMKERIAAKSAEQGFPRSRLIEFTPEEVDYVRGTSDIFGLNHYTTNIVYRNESLLGYFDSPSFFDDINVITYQKAEWKIGESEFTKVIIIIILVLTGKKYHK